MSLPADSPGFAGSRRPSIAPMGPLSRQGFRVFDRVLDRVTDTFVLAAAGVTSL
jgi:hypothetical protein